jgi:hypothetical protein
MLQDALHFLPTHSTWGNLRVTQFMGLNWSPPLPRRNKVVYIPIFMSIILVFYIFFPHCGIAPSGPGPPHYRGFTITLRHTTLGRAPLDEWSARRRDLYLTTHNTHKRQTSMPPAGFETTIPGSERPQTHAVNRAAIGIGILYVYTYICAMCIVISGQPLCRTRKYIFALDPWMFQ